MHELVKGYNIKGGKPRIVIKIDLMKTYDKVDWDFLLSTMLIMEFPDSL